MGGLCCAKDPVDAGLDAGANSVAAPEASPQAVGESNRYAVAAFPAADDASAAMLLRSRSSRSTGTPSRSSSGNSNGSKSGIFPSLALTPPVRGCEKPARTTLLPSADAEDSGSRSTSSSGNIKNKANTRANSWSSRRSDEDDHNAVKADFNRNNSSESRRSDEDDNSEAWAKLARSSELKNGSAVGPETLAGETPQSACEHRPASVGLADFALSASSFDMNALPHQPQQQHHYHLHQLREHSFTERFSESHNHYHNSSAMLGTPLSTSHVLSVAGSASGTTPRSRCDEDGMPLLLGSEPLLGRPYHRIVLDSVSLENPSHVITGSGAFVSSQCEFLSVAAPGEQTMNQDAPL